MKNGMKWIALAIAVLVSTSAWAVWDPDADTALVFNMNFEAFNNTTHTTTDADGGLVGTLADYNDTEPNVFGETGVTGLGFDANFAAMHDSAPGKGLPEGNDVKLVVPSNTGVFDLGLPASKHTWAFWFNVPVLEGTIIRHASLYYLSDDSYKNKLWEIRITASGVMEFYHKDNCLKMDTASTLSALGVTVNTWHHAAIVIDRSNSVETSIPTKQLSTKIYVDGVEVPVIVSSLSTTTMNVDAFYDSPLWIGAGEREFDGLLDDVRLYSRVLTPVEVSLLHQPDTTQPRALLPIPGSSSVIRSTDVNWVPAPGATAQKVYFGTNADGNLLPLKKTISDGATHIATNAEIGGPLTFNARYYWYIKSTIDGVDSNGPLWSFTSETGKAINVSPIDGAEDVNENFVDVNWTTPSAATYAVYLSQDQSLVAASSVSVRVANGITDHNVIVATGSRGAIYYWRVNSTYSGAGTIAGDIWSFRTSTYELVFNTSGVEKTYASHLIPAYTMLAHKDGWSDPCATGTVASDGTVVFDFNGFNYDRRYDVIVVPAYRATDINAFVFPAPLAIHVMGDFYYDGRVQIAGDDILNTTQTTFFARSGGFPGPKQNQDASVFADRTVTIADYWTVYPYNPADDSVILHGRFGDIHSTSAHYIYVPTALAKSTFGPGQPVNPPYKGGGGGGYGGLGGEAGYGYMAAVDTRGSIYGDKEVPVPFGGSAGGWGSGGGGGGCGGGGIEIAATGNIFLDVNSQILASGGSQLCSLISYANGGGSGGSVKIIAGGSVTNKGIIDVNGGRGGDGSAENKTGGGGGGGRVAIFYGTTKDLDNGTITANGGAKGTYGADPPKALAHDGQNGTIYVVNSSTVSPKKASAPTPANGDRMVYINHPDPCTNFQLKWYSGYGGTTDVVYCDTNPNPTTSRGSVAATRGQHSVTMTVASGNTYYMKVVTDGTVSSDIWSFKTVNWRCMKYEGTAPHLGGPEWDFNHDCVLDIEDFADFADAWLDPSFDRYVVDFIDFAARISSEWRQCFNRTDGGCAGF